MTIKQTLVDVAKDSPIPVITGVVLFGYSLDQWVLVFTLLWAVVRAFQVSLETYWKWKDRRDLPAREREFVARLEKAREEDDERQAGK